MHDVYWGSHGCENGTTHLIGVECLCCCECDDHAVEGFIPDDSGGGICVGAYPFYGPDTHFYGEDAGTAQTNFDLKIASGIRP